VVVVPVGLKGFRRIIMITTTTVMVIIAMMMRGVRCFTWLNGVAWKRKWPSRDDIVVVAVELRGCLTKWNVGTGRRRKAKSRVVVVVIVIAVVLKACRRMMKTMVRWGASPLTWRGGVV
jgi:hypothetical protein